MLKRCENGHFYDPDKHSTCPYCGVAVADLPATDRVRSAPAGGPEPPTVPRGHAAPPAPEPAPTPTPAPVTPAPPSAPPVAPHPADSGVTVAYWGKKDLDFDPVVGWLVCVEGPEKGRDYRIRSGNNRVGRDQTMDIVISGDDGISRIKQAILTFDERNNRFIIKEGEGRSLIYLNGEQVISGAPLEPWDIVEMGKSKFCFVPLCGDKFQWAAEEEEEK